jgi:putative SOS response-associated peptidase YedK
LNWTVELDSGKPFALAGLWEWWGGPDGKSPVETCSLITTEANELCAEVHDRMPVILDPGNYDAWLDFGNGDTASLQTLLKPLAADRMTTRPVNKYVSNARNEGEECLAPP